MTLATSKRVFIVDDMPLIASTLGTIFERAGFVSAAYEDPLELLKACEQDAPDAVSIGPYYRSDKYISHTNTREGFVNRLYHTIRKQTLADKERLIEVAVRMKQGKLLDIGAGTGAFTAYMQQRGWEATGLEPDETARERASFLHQVRLLPADSLYSFGPDSFDAITLWHVLEHVHELHAYIKQLAQLLTTNGKLFIAVPNYTSHDATVYCA